MFVAFESTLLANQPAIVDLVNFIQHRGTRFDQDSRSRDVNDVMKLARTALFEYNTKLRSSDIEIVYQMLGGYAVIGAIVYNGTLKASHDKARSRDVQLHVDSTMVIVTIGPSARPIAFERVFVHTPDNQAYKPTYFCPDVFLKYIANLAKGSVKMTKDESVKYLIDNLEETCGLVKSAEVLRGREIDLLIKYILVFGNLAPMCEKGETPEKYVISDKWKTKVHSCINTNPYFMFRHIWRIYFRLAKDGNVL